MNDRPVTRLLTAPTWLYLAMPLSSLFRRGRPETDEDAVMFYSHLVQMSELEAKLRLMGHIVISPASSAISPENFKIDKEVWLEQDRELIHMVHEKGDPGIFCMAPAYEISDGVMNYELPLAESLKMYLAYWDEKLEVMLPYPKRGAA